MAASLWYQLRCRTVGTVHFSVPVPVCVMWKRLCFKFHKKIQLTSKMLYRQHCCWFLLKTLYWHPVGHIQSVPPPPPPQPTPTTTNRSARKRGGGGLNEIRNLLSTITVPISVADPGCLSRIQKPQQKRGVKKISCHTFFCSQKFHKTENYFIF